MMKRVMALICVLISYPLLSAGPASATQLCSENEALKIAFPKADAFEKKILVMTREQLEKIQKLPNSTNASRIFKYRVAIKNGRVLGYAIVDTVLSRNAPMTFMVALDPDATVRRVEILAHIESPGKAVRQKGFLSQFEGKGVNDPVRIGSDIDAVTGATLSSRATADGVRLALARFSILVPVTSAQSDKLSTLDSRKKPKEEK